MKKQYKFTADKAKKLNKRGIGLVIYGENVPEANVVHISVKKGHFEEFYNVKSFYIYYIVEGKGIFVLNDERIDAQATDLIVVPPKTRIHYFGTMKIVLTVSPAYDEKNEIHVRSVDEKENPYDIK